MSRPESCAVDGPSAPWREFASQLRAALAQLAEGAFLILTVEGTGYFVQFAAQGDAGLRAEAVSNSYLQGDHRLGAAACRRLLDLGWQAPTNLPDHLGGYEREGSPNYFLQLPPPVAYERVAGVAVATLRSVFGALHPEELRYRVFDGEGAPLVCPPLARAGRRGAEEGKPRPN